MATDHEAARQRTPPATGRHVAAWAEMVTILLIGAFFVFSFLAGRVRFFVASAYVWLALLAAALLLAMGAARLFRHVRGRGACGCEAAEHTAWRLPSSVCVVLLILPMGLALAVNPRRYSPEGLRKRRVSAAPRDARFEQAVNWVFGLTAAGGKGGAGSFWLPRNPTVLDLLTAAQEGRRDALEGRFVAVLGQCDLPEGPGSRRFDLYRLVVTCCIADASAVSIEVVRPPTVALEPGGWVRVEGIVRFDSKIDPSLPVIHATMTSKIPEPSDPYL